MRIPRVYTRQPLSPGSEIELEESASHHLLKVLRMSQGREIRLFNGDNNVYLGHISQSTKKRAYAIVDAQEGSSAPSPLYTEIAIGLSKGDRFDFVIQKATELGVQKIVPLLSERSEIKLNAERAAKKHASWQQIIINACEQCQRNDLPEITMPCSLSDYLDSSDCERKFVLHHRSTEHLTAMGKPESAALLIGPEGGLSAAEIELAQAKGFAPLTLGPRVLRTETAPIAALSVFQFQWGDLAGG